MPQVDDAQQAMGEMRPKLITRDFILNAPTTRTSRKLKSTFYNMIQHVGNLYVQPT